ncbi:MAG: hypothetical protein HYV16_10495 [Gammaproteobacteria bacterium]|nr:hypothetical protein [Gammaproteobacteria bacterium]
MNAPRPIRTILVPEAQALGQIGVIRSLGAAGYRIVAASERTDALGFHSRHAHQHLVSPPADAPDLYKAWLDAVLVRESVDLIIPSERFVVALKAYLDEYRHLLAMGPDLDALRAAFSKSLLFGRFAAAECPEALSRNLPPYRLWRAGEPLPSGAELAALGRRLWLKTDGMLGASPADDGDVVEMSPETAASALPELGRRYEQVLIQGEAPGVGTGVFLIRWQGRIVAEFMYRGLHETPHTGGNSTLRETWWHDGQYRDALARLDYLGWDGVYMFEYRWDAETDRYALIEVNSRFWMSLHLALYAGVDFPHLLVDALQDRYPDRPQRPLRQACCRYTVPGEISHLSSKLKDHRLPLSERLGAVLEFLVLGLSPAIHSDLAWPGDRALSRLAWRHYLARLFRLR